MDDQPTNRRGADAVRGRDRRSPAADDLFAGTEPPPPLLPPIEKRDRDYWEGAIRAALAEQSQRSMLIAEQALSACPGDPDLLLLAALMALANADPEESMQTCGIHCSVTLSKALEDTFRIRYSGHCPTNDDKATTAVA